MKQILILIAFLFCFNKNSYCQSSYIEIRTNSDLTQRMAEALLPITIPLPLVNLHTAKITFFDLHYVGRITDSKGHFILAAKPGEADDVRHKPILRSDDLTEAQLINSIKIDKNAPDTVFLSFLTASWANGSLNFRVDKVLAVCKNPTAFFSDAVLDKIKSSNQINFSLPTYGIKFKISENQNLLVNMRPLFHDKFISYYLSPHDIVSGLKSSVKNISWNLKQHNSNSVIAVSSEICNYIIGKYFYSKKILLSKEGVNFELSKFKIANNVNRYIVSCRIHNLETNSDFIASLNMNDVFIFTNCTIKPIRPDLLSKEIALTIQQKINEKFIGRLFFKPTDLSQVLPFKLRNRFYKLYVDVFNIALEQSVIKLENQISIEAQ